MPAIDPLVLNLAVALGIGLLIGVERERRKSEDDSRSPAGLRTFAITALAGGIAFALGDVVLLATVTAGTVALAALAYWRAPQDDPGLTTEIALVLTTLLGGLAITRPALAAGLAVAVAVLLAARSPLHRFVRSVLTEDEVRDALIFAVATLVILPLLPDRPVGPFAAVNPRTTWIVVILVMAIGAGGYIAVRILGARFGLPLAGLAGGFISSTATIGAMGARARKVPELLAPAVAGAVLSTVATIVLLTSVLAVISPATLRAMAGPLAGAALAAMAYGAAFTLHALRQDGDEKSPAGHAFSLRTALLFAAILALMMVAATGLTERYGETGILLVAALAGFVDTHAAAISVASLVAADRVDSAAAVLPILAAFWTNTVSKMILAVSSGGWRFAIRVIPGLVLVALGAGAGALL